MKRTILIGALAAACAVPLGAQVVHTSRAAVLTDDAAEARTADDPQSDEILVWVLESKGKG